MTPPSPFRRYVLCFNEFEHPFVATLTAKPGLLCPTERRCRVADKAAVQAHHAVIQTFANLQRALEVARENIGDEAVFGGVRAADHLVLFGKGLDRGDRTEDL